MIRVIWVLSVLIFLGVQQYQIDLLKKHQAERILTTSTTDNKLEARVVVLESAKLKQDQQVAILGSRVESIRTELIRLGEWAARTSDWLEKRAKAGL